MLSSLAIDSFLEREWGGQISAQYRGCDTGDSLAMVAYVIGILPLIKNLKTDFPDITQPRYSDEAGELGTFFKSQGIFALVITTWPGTRVLS